MVFHWSLSDSKSSQVSTTLLSLLDDLNNAVVWMVSPRPPISKSSSPFTNLLATVTDALIAIGITITFMFHNFFLVLLKGSFSFILWSARIAKSTIRQVPFLLLTITRSGRLAEIRWSVCISKSQRSLCVSFPRADSGLCIYHLFVWSNINFLHNSQWITLPTQSCLVVYSFCVNLRHSLILWLIVLSLSPHYYWYYYYWLWPIFSFSFNLIKQKWNVNYN